MNKLFLKSGFVIVLLYVVVAATTLQADPAPPTTGKHNQKPTSIPGSGSAPLYGIIAFVIGISAGYGGRRLWKQWQKSDE